ncbi:hypothetical protein MON38_11110 [Hymenobacter sp. DH14]|uniref:Uncharacterized protein n=1 Tax=Hymenobacter cyanobacteriorum TaxID=2926463 RepID=A0A9X1VJ62_9BACT|nr:hypothetical protein [Hymenobacter cyanobacteriorum]MCI1187970.1 hypothetical protein [Hymenobacter cyanobacteriorum]
MNDLRKAAYRGILYNFLLSIRSIPTTLNDDNQAMKLGKFAGPVAYQLHNLALASVNDFVGFDEAQFWSSMDIFNNNNPDTQLTYLRTQFERDLLAS